MFCSFTRNPRILRLFGTGRVLRPDDAEFESLRTHFAELHPGTRAAIVVDVERIADACGYAVPYYELVDERPVLRRADAKAPARSACRGLLRLLARAKSLNRALEVVDLVEPLPGQVDVGAAEDNRRVGLAAHVQRRSRSSRRNRNRRRRLRLGHSGDKSGCGWLGYFMHGLSYHNRTAPLWYPFKLSGDSSHLGRTAHGVCLLLFLRSPPDNLPRHQRGAGLMRQTSEELAVNGR